MKKIYFSFLFSVFLTNLSAEVIASDRVIDGLCELYYEQSRAGRDYGYSSARSMNKRIKDYRARFGLQDFDERECGNFGSYGGYREGRAYDRGYEDGYYDSYDDRRRYQRGRGYDRGYNRSYERGYERDPWNDRSRGGAHNPQNPWDD